MSFTFLLLSFTTSIWYDSIFSTWRDTLPMGFFDPGMDYGRSDEFEVL